METTPLDVSVHTLYMLLSSRSFQSQHAENMSRRRRANMLILAITVIFFVSWLPLNLFTFVMALSPKFLRPVIEGMETVIYALLHLCGLSNACINPVLYGYLNENFRKEYKNIYRWEYRSRTVSTAAGVSSAATAPPPSTISVWLWPLHSTACVSQYSWHLPFYV